MFLSGSDCHRLGLDRIDDHMIIITPVGYLSKLSCILLLICIIFFPDVCSVVSSASMSQSTDISFRCNGRSLMKRLKGIGTKTEPCGTPYFTDSLEE